MQEHPGHNSGLKKHIGMDWKGGNEVKSVVMEAHILDAKHFDDSFE